MKPAHRGHARLRQKMWHQKYMARPFTHKTRTKGEPLCGEAFSHNYMGETGRCPHCDKNVRLMVPFFGEPYWVTRDSQ